MTTYRNPAIDEALGAPTLLFGQPEVRLPRAELAAAVAALPAEARARGCTQVLGPMDGSTWRSYRAVLERSGASFVGDLETHADLPEVLAKAGYRVTERYASTSLSRKAADRSIRDYRTHTCGRAEDVRLRPVTSADFLAEVEALYPLVTAAFSRNRLYSPIGREDFLALYRPLASVVRDGWLRVAEVDGRAVGFVLFLEDPRGLVIKTLGRLPGDRLRAMGVAPERLGAAMALRSFEHFLASGHGRLVSALMHEANPSYARSLDFGGAVVARYGLFGREL